MTARGGFTVFGTVPLERIPVLYRPCLVAVCSLMAWLSFASVAQADSVVFKDAYGTITANVGDVANPNGRTIPTTFNFVWNDGLDGPCWTPAKYGLWNMSLVHARGAATPVASINGLGQTGVVSHSLRPGFYWVTFGFMTNRDNAGCATQDRAITVRTGAFRELFVPRAPLTSCRMRVNGASRGGIGVTRGGVGRKLNVGDYVNPGDMIRTNRSAHLVLKGTLGAIRLAPNSKLSIVGASCDGARQHWVAYLPAGRVSGRIANPSGRAQKVMFQTNGAELQALGSTFELKFARQPTPHGTTLVNILGGSATVTNRNGTRKTVGVRAGHGAAVTGAESPKLF